MLIKNTLFYKSLTKLLAERIPNIKASIENSLENFEIFYALEKHTYSSNAIEWRIYIDFDNYAYDILTQRPFQLGGFISIEEITDKKVVICNFGKIYNSFNPNIKSSSYTSIDFSNLNNLEIINSAIKNVNSFLNEFEKSFLKEVNLIDKKKLE